MKITVVNGTEKHGITYRLKEIFLEADLLVFTSPAYVFHATGAMKGPCWIILGIAGCPTDPQRRCSESVQ